MGLEEGKCERRGREDSRRLDITRWLLSPRQPTTHKRTTTRDTTEKYTNREKIVLLITDRSRYCDWFRSSCTACFVVIII